MRKKKKRKNKKHLKSKNHQAQGVHLVVAKRIKIRRSLQNKT